MTFGTVSAILQLVNKVQSPFKDISSLIPKALSVFASVERILELEDLKGENEDGQALSREIYKTLRRIEFKNVNFSYDEKQVLTNASFIINKGELAVIGGESGAGKSTAIKLMLGIITPDSGEVFINTDTEKIPLLPLVIKRLQMIKL